MRKGKKRIRERERDGQRPIIAAALRKVKSMPTKEKNGRGYHDKRLLIKNGGGINKMKEERRRNPWAKTVEVGSTLNVSPKEIPALLEEKSQMYLHYFMDGIYKQAQVRRKTQSK